MRRTVTAVVGAAAMFSFIHFETAAHSEATGVVKERMELMKTIGDATKSLADMMKGSVPYDADQVRDLAKIIEDHGGETLTGKFPKDSLDHPSEAVPDIWTEWDTFSRLADQMVSYAGALRMAAGNPRGVNGGGMMMGSGMMSQGGGMMMGGNGPSADHLATMPPDAAFMHVTQTCSACHQDLRKKKE